MQRLLGQKLTPSQRVWPIIPKVTQITLRSQSSFVVLGTPYLPRQSAGTVHLSEKQEENFFFNQKKLTFYAFSHPHVIVKKFRNTRTTYQQRVSRRTTSLMPNNPARLLEVQTHICKLNRYNNSPDAVVADNGHNGCVTNAMMCSKRSGKSVATQDVEKEKNKAACAFSHLLVRHPAMRCPARMNEIYVTRKYPLVVYFQRAATLLKDPRIASFSVYGLGVCIMTSVWLVQDLLDQFSPLISLTKTETRTVSVFDDFSSYPNTSDSEKTSVDNRDSCQVNVQQ